MAKKLVNETCISLKGKKTLLIGVVFASLQLPAFSQDWSQQFQRAADNNGWYRNLGDIGFVNPTVFWGFNINRYLDNNTYLKDGYPSVIKGKIWRAFNIIDVPNAIKKVMTDTKAAKGTSFKPCLMEEFIFPYKWGASGDVQGFLIIIVYGQETWGRLIARQLFLLEWSGDAKAAASRDFLSTVVFFSIFKKGVFYIGNR